jgi:hypothetical protein
MSQQSVKGLAALVRPTMNAVQRSSGLLAAQPATATATALLPDPMQRSTMATAAPAAALGAKPGAAEFVMTKVSTLLPDTSLIRDICVVCASEKFSSEHPCGVHVHNMPAQHRSPGCGTSLEASACHTFD